MSATISADLVRQLREITNAGMMDCKKALEATGGNLEAAETWLRKQGAATAQKKASRITKEGVIASYIHAGGKVGVLIEVNCETDFVARNENFREFVKDITLQIAAANPICITREEVDPSIIEKEKEITAAQYKDKPPAAVEKIIAGKIEKFYSTICLLEQPYVKDPDITIKELLTRKIAEIGENIVIKRFTRYQLGE
jgi:elongation factor Ts